MSIPDQAGLHKGQGSGNGLDEAYIGAEAPKGSQNGLGGGLKKLFGDWVLVACVLLLAALCFGLGTLATKQNQHSDKLWIEQLPAGELGTTASSSAGAGAKEGAQAQPARPQSNNAPTTQNLSAAAVAASASAPTTGTYVASKTGTKYYLPTCATAKRIKDTNKVYFDTKAQAESAGYQPAANCKGL